MQTRWSSSTAHGTLARRRQPFCCCCCWHPLPMNVSSNKTNRIPGRRRKQNCCRVGQPSSPCGMPSRAGGGWLHCPHQDVLQNSRSLLPTGVLSPQRTGVSSWHTNRMNRFPKKRNTTLTGLQPTNGNRVIRNRTFDDHLCAI